jgi:Ca-activated chloride channel family protein
MTVRRLLAAVVVAGLASGAASAQNQSATFRARHEAVRVDVLVQDHGKPVKGLRPEDFEIFDSGVPQQPELLGADASAINAVLALDLSGSVAGDRLDHLRRASRAALDALKPSDRAALITFTHVVELDAALTTDIPSVLTAFDRARAGGRTALVDAICTGFSIGETDNGRSLLIVLSDGHDTSSWLTPETALDLAKRSAVVVYGVSVREPKPAVQAPALGLDRYSNLLLRNRLAAEQSYGAPVPDARPVLLQDLTTLTGGSLSEVESVRNLDALFAGIVQEFRDRYLIGYSPTGVPADGWHKIEVRVKGRTGLTVHARPGYQRGSGSS